MLAAAPDGPLGVAVSGGGDSMALLHLAADWGKRPLFAVTIDHGLRKGSAAEAIGVGLACRGLGIHHTTIEWEGWDGKGNLQDRARHARRRLIADWAREKSIHAILLGHTADDQAETFLMRLSRGSGVEGLSGMEAVIEDRGLTWLRPMLHLRRDALRGYLSAQGVEWVDDPSNEDPRFDRSRVREALKTLEPEGIDVPGIVATTQRLRSAKMVLYTATKDLAEVACEMTEAGEMRIDHPRIASAEQAVRLRLMSEAVRYVAGSHYAPRAYAVEAMLDDIAKGRLGSSLHGCLIRKEGETLSIRREPARVGEPVKPGMIWDNRWSVEGPGHGSEIVAALGENGLNACPSWRESGHPREVLLTTPGVWRDGELVAAPMANFPNGWCAKLAHLNAFFTTRHLAR